MQAVRERDRRRRVRQGDELRHRDEPERRAVLLRARDHLPPAHPPSEGCSRTPGYWKTHSSHGPAPYDATWAKVLPSGADPPFFGGGQSWFEVLWTDSAAGNAHYIILARAFIAAKLNLLAGASAPDEVNAALAWAQASFFTTYGPGSTLPKDVRGLALAYAGVLDNYNNGYIGPGHCP